MTMTKNERAIAAVRKVIHSRITMIKDQMFSADENHIKFMEEKFSAEIRYSQMYLATLRRELAADHEAWVDACKELRILEGDADD